MRINENVKNITLIGVVNLLASYIAAIMFYLSGEILLKFLQHFNLHFFNDPNAKQYAYIADVPYFLHIFFIFIPTIGVLAGFYFAFNQTKKHKGDPYRFASIKKRFFKLPKSKLFQIQEILERQDWNITDLNRKDNLLEIQATKIGTIYSKQDSRYNKFIKTKVLNLTAEPKDGDDWKVCLICRDKQWYKIGDPDASTYYVMDELIAEVGWESFQYFESPS